MHKHFVRRRGGCVTSLFVKQ